MKELEQLLELNRDIDILFDKLAMRRYSVTAPKRQILSDMPKGGGCRVNEIEDYIIHSETLRNDIRKLSETLEIKWLIFLNNYAETNLTVEERNLLELRFMHGYKWKVCAKQMDILYPNEGWNENKVFRTYRNIIQKIEKWQCDN